MEEFKMKPLEERKNRFRECLAKYPDHLMIIVEAAKGSQLPPLANPKLLAKRSITVNQFIQLLRKSMQKISEDKTINLFSMQQKSILKANDKIGDVYEKSADDDGFLYLYYADLSALGSAE